MYIYMYMYNMYMYIYISIYIYTYSYIYMYTYTSTGFAFCHDFCGHRRTTPGAKVARSAIGAIARHGLPDVYVAEREGAEGPAVLRGHLKPVMAIIGGIEVL